ncbi:MAG: hypothetical protein M3Y77_00160 [Actinomycetota bacterium]|nr:hypothetical protein [Actinomycetota bacterium]
MTEHGVNEQRGAPVAESPGEDRRSPGRPERPADDDREDLDGQDSFPASDPPSTWWGESRAQRHQRARDS